MTSFKVVFKEDLSEVRCSFQCLNLEELFADIQLQS